MEDLLNHLEYSKLFIIISVGMIALTYLTHIIFRNERIIKFFPGIISLFIGIYAILTINGEVIFLDDTNKFTMFVIATAVGFIGIGVALILGIFNKGKGKRKKRIIKKEEAI